MSAIEEILKSIRPEFDFTASQDFVGDGMLDSFDLVTLISELDRMFGISIDGIDIVPDNVRSVAAIKTMLAKYGVQP